MNRTARRFYAKKFDEALTSEADKYGFFQEYDCLMDSGKGIMFYVFYTIVDGRKLGIQKSVTFDEIKRIGYNTLAKIIAYDMLLDLKKFLKSKGVL